MKNRNLDENTRETFPRANTRSCICSTYLDRCAFACMSQRGTNECTSGDPLFFFNSEFKNRESEGSRNIAEFSNSIAAWATLVGGDSALARSSPIHPVYLSITMLRTAAGAAKRRQGGREGARYYSRRISAR